LEIAAEFVKTSVIIVKMDNLGKNEKKALLAWHRKEMLKRTHCKKELRALGKILKINVIFFLNRILKFTFYSICRIESVFRGDFGC